jgi:hypothetical protein
VLRSEGGQSTSLVAGDLVIAHHGSFLPEGVVSVPDRPFLHDRALHLLLDYAPPNFTLKLSRPGFGPGLKPLVPRKIRGVTAVAVRHSVLRTSLAAIAAPHGLRHAGPGRAA